MGCGSDKMRRLYRGIKSFKAEITPLLKQIVLSASLVDCEKCVLFICTYVCIRITQ